MKNYAVIAWLIAVFLCLTGCHSVTTFTTAAYEETEQESIGFFERNINYLQNPDWGLTLSAKDVTPTGMTIVFIQRGGSVTGTLSTAFWYRLQKLTDYGWIEVETILPEDEVFWGLSAIPITLEESTEIQVDWEWLYGQLSPGEYRISQEVKDYRYDANYDETILWLQFEIR